MVLLLRSVALVLVISFTLVGALKFNDEQVNQEQQPIQQTQQGEGGNVGEERRNGKHLLDFVGLGTGNNVDPFIAQVNGKCLNGELSECFKSQALNTFNEFFNKEVYPLSPHVRVVRLPETQTRSLEYEPFEYSAETRQHDSEWDQLMKFALRKAERFLKSNAIEVQIPDEVTEGGRYQPRFIDEISDELDVIENKKAPLLFKKKIKSMFIPMLVILKLFKLKLLLFLPFILGLAGFKKILGFAAILIPGIIGYFKLCRPSGGQGLTNHLFSNGYSPQYSSQGLGAASYNQYSQNPSNYYRADPSFASPYNNYYRDGSQSETGENSSNGVRFGEDGGQDLAYQQYSQEYRNKKTE
ncbi:unnamed protein product [Diamesa hyperborea]